MILKVPPSDLYKNANLAELRCDKNNLYWYSVYIENFEVYRNLYLLNYALHICKVMQKTYMLYLQYVDLYVVRT